jgi:hypothetical protein
MSSELTRRQVLGGIVTIPAVRFSLFARPPKLVKRAVSLDAVATIQVVGQRIAVGSGLYTASYGGTY